MPYEVDDVRVATLDATPGSADTDLFFTLACLESTQVAYLTPYSLVIPEYVNTYFFGIWDDANEIYLQDQQHIAYSPILTDDGSSIYTINNAELRQILDILTYATEGLEPDHYFVAGMWDEDNFDASRLWSEFDPAGIDNVLRYLTCFSDAQAKPGTPLQVSAELQRYANQRAGGPGAIYIGDLHQLVGPAPTYDLGDGDGNVPLYALEQHEWIYESDYYQSLLEKAKIANPTPLSSRGERITIRHACINRALLPCILIQDYWVPNLEARTDGQLKLVVTSFPELGVAGPDTLQLVSDGTLSMANVYNGYIAGELPVAEVLSLWGLYPDHQTSFESSAVTLPGLDAILTQETDGGVVINHNWYSGNDQFIFSKKPLRTLEDFRRLKTRSHSASLSDWINGIGAEAQFLAFAEVYTALERGILDAGVTGATPGYGQRWYEVIGYMNGPLTSWLPTSNVFNTDVWNSIPADLQQIFIEEAAKSELEQLRLASIQNLVGVQDNSDAGIELVEFSPEIREHSFNVAVMENVIPGWLRRLGYPGRNYSAVSLFNEYVGPYVGLRIESDGSVTQTRITEGPHAGKTMEQVLSE